MLSTSLAAQLPCAAQSDSLEVFRPLLQKFTDFSPGPCGPPYGREQDWHSANVESPLFEQAAEIVVRALNATSKPGSPRDRTTQGLKQVEKLSAEVNSTWPEDNRFHFEILDIAPAVVVKMSVRTHSTYFVFGIPEKDRGKPNSLWRNIGQDEQFLEHEVPSLSLDLYALHRGTSGNPRFLAAFTQSGCAGSIGVAYDAREWDPRGSGSFEKIIEQTGAFGLGDVKEFPQIGNLQTRGPLITLPYCWFSAIDTWDNPSLCAVDTYDLSGDDVRFRTRTYNRPDLVPIAKAVEYARQRDYPALLGYCASSDVARKLVRDIPPYMFAGDLRLTNTGEGKEHIEFGFDRTYRFDVGKLAGRWRIVAFSTE